MAIRHRQGDYNNFEPSKMVAGEFAYVNSNDPATADGKGVYATFTGGKTKRLCTYEEVSGLLTSSLEQAEEYVEEAKGYEENSKTYSENAKTSETNAENIAEEIQEMLEDKIPNVFVDWATGNLMYSGGNLVLWIDNNGYLNWGRD